MAEEGLPETVEDFAEWMQAIGYCLDGTCGKCGACQLRATEQRMGLTDG